MILLIYISIILTQSVQAKKNIVNIKYCVNLDVNIMKENNYNDEILKKKAIHLIQNQ